MYFDLSYSPIWDEAGKVGGVLCIVSETTERVVAQERQRLLLREANHRLKNLFAMIDALIGLSVRSARTPQEFAQALRGRLAALLRAKELARPGTLGTEHAVSESTTVEALVRAILQPYDNDTSRVRISTNRPDVLVGATAVTSLALVLHESQSNTGHFQSRMARSPSLGRRWAKRSISSGSNSAAQPLAPLRLTALVVYLPSEASASLEARSVTIGNAAA